MSWTAKVAENEPTMEFEDKTMKGAHMLLTGGPFKGKLALATLMDSWSLGVPLERKSAYLHKSDNLANSSKWGFF
jgi:hypothetical protein